MLYVSEDLPVPKLMCVAWYSLDVLFTSSTIIHLCMISVDRYMSFKYPLKYGHAKKTKHTVFKIVLVWIISFCIAGPLFLFSMFDTQKEVYYKGCGPETTTFVLSATITSFYLPLLIMTIMYILTVKALHHQRKAQQKLSVTNCGSSSWSLKDGVSTGLPRKSLPKQASAESRDSGAGGRSPLLGHKQYLKSPDTSPTYTRTGRAGSFLCVENHIDSRGGLTPSSTCTDIAMQDLDSHPEDSHQNGSNGSHKLKVRTFRFKRENTSNSSRKNNIDKGRRAVQVLGILFAVFVIFYLPFFATYTINATCLRCQKYISPQMIMAFEWLAYSGSMVNPIVYHIFNPEFRRAFHRLLRCKCRRTPR